MTETGWETCPHCPTRLPAWAKRAKWEHMDSAHRDEPMTVDWAAESDKSSDHEHVTDGPESAP